MRLSELQYQKSINKINLDTIYNYEDIKDEINSCAFSAILTNDIVCLDIDDKKSRALLKEAHEKNLLSQFVYSYKPLTDSFHFYFVAKDLKLRNKNTYLSAGNFEYEFLNKNVVVFDNNNTYVNFDKEIPPLHPLFWPCASKSVEWLFKGVIETLSALKGASEGDKRSLNLFKLTSNLKAKMPTEAESAEFFDLYQFYNQLILKQPLSDNEISNNIGQIFQQPQNTNTLLNFENCLIITNKKTTLKLEEFAEELLQKYCMFQYNSTIYLYFDEKFLQADSSYYKIPDVLYYLISKIFKEINHIYHNANLDLSVDKYNELKKILVKKVPFLNNHNLDFHNKIRLKNGLIKLNSDGTHEFIYGDDRSKTINHFDINYNPIVTRCEKIEKFLEEIFVRETPEQTQLQIKSFWQMTACAFMSHNLVRKAFILKGKGKNGKSTLINFIKKLVGTHNTSALSLEQINSQFMLNEMMNKTLNINDEMLSVLNVDSHIFKSLISGGYITSDVKHAEAKKWNNNATLIFASNNKLKVQKYHSAISDRLYIISLLNRFDGKSDKKNIEQSLLSTDEDYSYCFNKILEALSELIQNHWCVTQTDDSINNLNEFINYNSVIRKFLINNRYVEIGKTTQLAITTKGFDYFSNTSVVLAYNDFCEWSDLNTGDTKYRYGLERFKELLEDDINLLTTYNDAGDEIFQVY